MTVTMETRGDGCYVETWSKDGYNIVTTGNKDDITVEYPGGKEIKVSKKNTRVHRVSHGIFNALLGL